MVQLYDVNLIYKKFPECKKEDVQKLEDWAKLQPHLPQLTELQLALFLHCCFYSNEAAKVCIDNYYTIRAVSPEFFANRNPTQLDIQAQCKVGMSVLMPKLTNEGYRVVYSNLIDTSPENYVYSIQIKLEDMTIMLTQMLQGPAEGYIGVIDCKGGQLSHLSKFGLLTTKKLLYYLQEAVPIRLLQIHLINVVPVVDLFFNMAKPFLKKELLKKVYFHTKMDTVYKTIPKDCLPDTVGGTGGNLEELYAKTFKTFEDNADYLKDEEKEISDESKRVGKPRNIGDMFGVEGTFKKLDID